MASVLLLLACLGTDPVVDLSKRPTLIVYLWDYETDRNPESVQHLPKYRNSRFVREALTGQHPDTDLAYAQDRLHTAAVLRIVDDYRTVDQLPCPCYAFTGYEAAVEIGNAWAVDEHGTRGPPYHDQVSMCRHLAYLAELYVESQRYHGGIGYRRDMREYREDLGEVVILTKHSSALYGPLVDPWPPIRYDLDVESSTTVVRSLYVGGVTALTEERSYEEHVVGDTDALLFYSQMDMGSRLLTPHIREKVDHYYPADFFEVGSEYVIPLVKRDTITAKCTGRDGDVVGFLSSGAVVSVDLTKSAVTITRTDNNGPLFGIPGTWRKAVEVHRRITRSSPQ